MFIYIRIFLFINITYTYNHTLIIKKKQNYVSDSNILFYYSLLYPLKTKSLSKLKTFPNH